MLRVLTLDQSNDWDSIVRSFENHDVYYLSNYVKAFFLHGDGTPLLFYYNQPGLRAMNVVMKRDISDSPVFQGKIPNNQMFDLTTPYGYGGFLFSEKGDPQLTCNLNEAYVEYCAKNGIVSEFVRFHPILRNSIHCTEIYDIVNLGKTVTMNLNNKDQIWNDLTSKNRNVIRKASKSGVEIYWGRDRQLFHEFIPLYNATMDKEDATKYYYFDEPFYYSILHDLKYNSLIFYALLDQQVIAMSMFLLCNRKMHYHLSCSNTDYKNLASTNLLLYEAACWGCENGYKLLHLGGGLGSTNDGLFKFKSAFNKNSDTIFSIGKKIFIKETYNELISIRSQNDDFDSNTTFFPQYRSTTDRKT